MSGFIASIFLFFLKMARKSFSSFLACFWPHFGLSDLLNNLSEGKTIVKEKRRRISENNRMRRRRRGRRENNKNEEEVVVG